MVLLTTLYAFQGVPLGLTGTLTYTLKKYLSYTELGIFSLAYYPFSLKFLWSPMVDTMYIKWLGRRRTYVVILGFLSGLLMYFISFEIDEWIRNSEHVTTLTLTMFVVIFMYATQDIAIDAWGLEMLKPENKGYVSTCQSVGQTIGYYMGFSVFLALNSVEFCNTWIFAEPREVGFAQLSDFFYLWGIANVVFSIIVLLFRPESTPADFVELTFTEVYSMALRLFTLPHYRKWVSMVMIRRIPFFISGSILPLVLIEKGFSEATMGVIAIYFLPLQVISSMVIGYYITSNKSCEMYLMGYKGSVLLLLLELPLIYLIPDGGITTTHVIIIIMMSIPSTINGSLKFCSDFGFMSFVADTSFGGTYITLMTTISNFSGTWLGMILYPTVDLLTMTIAGQEIQGYAILAVLSALLGIVMIFVLQKHFVPLQELPPEMWTVPKETSKTKKE